MNLICWFLTRTSYPEGTLPTLLWLTNPLTLGALSLAPTLHPAHDAEAPTWEKEHTHWPERGRGAGYVGTGVAAWGLGMGRAARGSCTSQEE